MPTAEDTVTLDVDVREKTSKMAYPEINAEVNRLTDAVIEMSAKLAAKKKAKKRVTPTEIAELKSMKDTAAEWAKVALDRSART